tara:strand:- start:1045 stop:1266 length:222 start_codon:yes stop_codon:yes gene_type:complete
MSNFITMFSRRILERLQNDPSNPLSSDKSQETEESEKVMIKTAKSADKKITDLEHDIREIREELDTLKNTLDS